jgi:ankyrin repeat protein
MRGAPTNVADKNGFTPIHLAAQSNNFELIMVLLNIGVDVNAVTISGTTPLYLAYACNAHQAIHLLEKNGAQLNVEPQNLAPGSTVLDIDCNSKSSTISLVSDCLALPSEHFMF